MQTLSIEWRNLGPYGNKLQKIEFPKEGALWMVVGRNGSGKSWFVNLPKIGYYGKLDKFKKGEISNRMNSHGYIKLIDQVSPDTLVTIERNFSPSNLTVYKAVDNDDEIDIGKAGISDYQTYIDTEVTGLPYGIFSNIISLSVNDFKSFISMTPNDKRIIIDKLFAMEVINKMNELVKKDLREVKLNMDLFDREIISLKNNIRIATEELKILDSKLNEDNTAKIKTLEKQLSEYKPKLISGYEKKTQWETKKNEIENARNVFIRQKAKLTSEIDQINKQINLYNQEKCPTCTTPFNDNRFLMIKEELQKNLEVKRDEINTLKTDEAKYAESLKKILEGIQTINSFIIQVESTCKSLESEMKRLKVNKSQEFSSIQRIIANNNKELVVKSQERTGFNNDHNYLAILEQLYSDSGIKKKVLENYLPTLNKEISYTLNELHFPYTLVFNSDFEPEMHHLGIEIGVDTLSTGEKKRVDLAVLISIIRMLKRKYPGLNIFMLDEILSSIDGDGIYDIIGLLQKITKEMNMNIFVINHSLLPIEQFDFKVDIFKNAGFSDLVIEELNEKS